MGKLTCNCLNVQIHTKSELLPFDQSTIDEIHRTSDCCREFFGQDLSEVLLNLEGVCVAHPALLRARTCGQWLVHQCINCDAFTHATSTQRPDDCRVLVRAKLLDDETAFENLLCSEDYSQAYKIVLKSSSEITTPQLPTDLMSLEVRSEMETIQRRLDTFLVTEESNMDERIRLYQQQERDRFATLQSKALSDKNVMILRLLSTVYRTVSESLSDAMVESPVGSVVDQMQAMHVTPCKADDSQPPATPNNDVPSQPAEPDLPDPNANDDDDDILFPLPRLLVARSNSTSARQRSVTSPSDILPDSAVSQNYQLGPPGPIDDVFQFDPGFQDDPNEPFSESDEDVDDTDDSSTVDDGIQRSSHSSGSSSRGVNSGGGGGLTSRGPGAGFSTSVPIDVPAWMGSSSNQHQVYQFNDEDGLDMVPRDPARMAASIQAMARSVHGRTSEIFGELPKPPTRASISSQRTTSRR